MPEKELSARPNLEQYKKQAKDLARDCRLQMPEALTRLKRHHPRFHKLAEPALRTSAVSLTDAQLVLAREHGFESWPKFAAHVETLRMVREVEELEDPLNTFLEVACVDRHGWHSGGTIEYADLILKRYLHRVPGNIFSAAVLGDEPAVRAHLRRDPSLATAKGGPHHWDALTYLCFSKYLRFDKSRPGAFVRTAQVLLDAGASANTGWIEMIDHPNPRPTFESAIYGAAGIAQHPELTRLLLEHGADPNDEETAYHVAEGYDNTVMQILLESGRLNEPSLVCLLVRKADWHDEAGMRLVLEHGADPNATTRWDFDALHQAIRRDNGIEMIRLLLDHGADPSRANRKDGRSAVAMAAWRGRGDVLRLLEERGMELGLQGLDQWIAACATADRARIASLAASDSQRQRELITSGGALLAESAGNGNTEGVRCLLQIGVPVDALYEGDPYFEIPKGSTALHVAAWRMRPETLRLLLERAAPVNAVDSKGRAPLWWAVRACVDSHWKQRRTPETVRALLEAGATVDGIDFPCGYAEVDALLAERLG